MPAIGNETRRYLDSTRLISFFHQEVVVEGGRAISPYNADMSINRRNSLVGAGLEKLASDDLFYCQHHTVLASDADSCSSVLDSLHSVLNLFD